MYTDGKTVHYGYDEQIRLFELKEGGRIDIVNIGLHFFLKNVRPYAASCSEA